MNKIKTNNTFKNSGIILFLLFFILAAQSASATEISVKSSNSEISVGDIVSADVMIDTEGENLNVIEGDISVPTSLNLIEIKEINTASSVLNQWVRVPSWSEKDGIISFTGGLPGGFNQKSATLFRIFFTAKSTGPITFLPTQIKAYINDGLATQAGVHVSPLTINISSKGESNIKDEFKALNSSDTQAPENINIDLGSDASLFDGQKFISISASDTNSGVAYFEVKEGNREPVKTSGNYVLQNQDKLEPIIIFAFDKAGNISRKSLTPQTVAAATKNNNSKIIVSLLISLATLCLLFISYKIIKGRRKIKK